MRRTLLVWGRLDSTAVRNQQQLLLLCIVACCIPSRTVPAVAAATAADAGGVSPLSLSTNCLDGVVPLRSNSRTEFVVCTGTTPLNVALVPAEAGGRVVSNISLIVRGGGASSALMPRVSLQHYPLVLQHVVIAFLDLRVVGNAPNDTREMVWLSAAEMHNVSLLMRNCSVVDAIDGIGGVGFVAIVARNATNVTVRMDGIVWVGRLPRAVRLIDVGGRRSSLNGIAISLHRCWLNLTTISTDLGGLIVLTAVSATAISIGMDRTAVGHRLLCNAPSVRCSEAALVWMQMESNASTFRDVHLHLLATNATMGFEDNTVNMTEENDSLVLSVVHLSGSRSSAAQRVAGMTIRVHECAVVLVAKQHTGVLKFDDVLGGMHNTTIAVANTTCDFTVSGNVVQSRGSRLSAVITVYSTLTLHDALISMEHVTARHAVMSGALPSMLDSSGLLLVAADALHLASAVGVRVALLHVHQTVTMDNGTVPCVSGKSLPPEVCVIGTTVGAALLRLGSPVDRASDFTLSIEHCTLNVVEIHLLVASREPQHIVALGFASYHITLVCITTFSLLNATIVVHNTSMVVRNASIRFAAHPRDAASDTVVGGALISFLQMQPVNNLISQLLSDNSFIKLFLLQYPGAFPVGDLLLRNASIAVSRCTMDLSSQATPATPLAHAYTAMLLAPSISARVDASFADSAIAPPSAHTSSNTIGSSSSDGASSMLNPTAIGCFVNCSFDASHVRFTGVRAGRLLHVTSRALASVGGNSTVVLRASTITGGRGRTTIEGDDDEPLGLIHVGTNTGAALHVDGGASFLRVAQCVLLHLDQLVVAGDQPLVAAAGGDAEGSLLALERGAIVIGCNAWDDVPFPSRSTSVAQFGDLSNGGHVVVFDELQEAAVGGAWCAVPKFSGTATATASVPAPPRPPDGIYSPPLTPPSAAVAVAAFVSPLDSIALIAFGQSACAPPAVRQATSAAQFLISPMYVLGPIASVYGNMGLVALVLLLHFTAVRVASSVRAARQVAKGSPPPQEAAVAGGAPTTRNPSAIETLPPRRADARSTNAADDGWAQLRFPNYSIAMGMYWSSGVAFYTSRLLLDGSGAGSVVLGLLSVAALGAACILWWRFEVRVLRRLLRFERYRAHIIHAVPAVPRWALPLGRWGPVEARHKYGRLRGFVRRGYERYALLPLLVRLLSSLVMGVPVEGAWWCPVQAAILSVMAAGATGTLLVVRPARVPASGWLLSALYMLQIGTYASSAASKLSANHDTAAVDAAMAFSVLHAIVALVKNAHTALLFLWERMRSHSPDEVVVPVKVMALHAPIAVLASNGCMRLGASALASQRLAPRRRTERLSHTDIHQNLHALIELAANVGDAARRE